MITTMITPMITPMITSMISGGGAATREIYTANGSTDYVEIPPFLPAGDFSVKLKVIGLPQGNNKIFSMRDSMVNRLNLGTSSSGGSEDGLRVFSRGTGSTVGMDGTAVVFDGTEKVVELMYTLSTGIVEVYVDGVLDIITEALTPLTFPDMSDITDVSIYQVAGSTSGSFVGAVYDVEISDSATPANDSFLPIDDGWANNPVILDTLNGHNGTAISFIEGSWSTL